MKTWRLAALSTFALLPFSYTLLTAFAQSSSDSAEPYRPRFHFSPAKNWTNDPNGLIYDGSEYHLFFQYNPFGDQWGHMSWGHAVSKDLTRWQELPVALAEENGIMMFTGSTVLDARNTSGFGRNGAPPLVAIYTGHSTGLQTQNIAYSTDRGRTWTKYAGNPVIDIHEAEFRDPMVFWHEPTRRWIMVVSLAKLYKIRFYSSPDLKTWSALSEFGPAGVQAVPNWECPNIFPLPVANASGQRKWVLMIGVGDGALQGGSGTEYFVGDFDGTRFVNDNPPEKTLWVDYGADYYAGQTWSNVPAADGRRIMLAWMDNWKYADKLPTRPWRGQMSYPRTLGLRQTPDGIRLTQNPVRELKSLRSRRTSLKNVPFAKAVALLNGKDWPETLEISATLNMGDSQDAGVELRKGPSAATRVGYDARRKVVYIDRRHSGEVSFHPQFAARHEAPLEIQNGSIQLHILLDRCSVEVFADDGRVALTDLIFPRPADRKLALYAEGKPPSITSLDVWTLK